jgi:hypothetical protein
MYINTISGYALETTMVVYRGFIKFEGKRWTTKSRRWTNVKRKQLWAEGPKQPRGEIF